MCQSRCTGRFTIDSSTKEFTSDVGQNEMYKLICVEAKRRKKSIPDTSKSSIENSTK